MRLLPSLLLCLVTSPLAVACGDDDKATDTTDTTSPDTTDTSSPDTTADTSSPDTTADTSSPYTTADTSSPDTTPPDPTSVEDRVAQTYCDWISSCRTYDIAEDIYSLLLREANDEQCRTFVKLILRDEAYDAKIAAGDYTLVEANMAACERDFPTLCNNDFVLACRDFVEGKVATDGACRFDADCAGDAFCKGDFGCEGVCAPRVAEGAECETNESCTWADGKLACSYESYSCVPFATSDDATEGAPCGEVHTPTSVTYVRCADGLGCGSDDTCEPIVAPGEPCQDDHTPCTLGNVCVPVSEEARECGPFPITGEVGADCSQEFEIGATFCNPVLGLGCHAGKCEQTGDGSVGARCVRLDGPSFCAPGNYCSADDACAAKKPEGATCTDYDECQSDNCDYDGEGDSGTCGPSFCSE